MFRLRQFAPLFFLAVAICVFSLWPGHSRSDSVLRRLTNTAEEGISLNPSISGDGRIIGFESTEDIAGVGGPDRFRAIRTDITLNSPAFSQLAFSRATAPALSQDGSRVAFASTDDPLGKNADGNSELFFFDGSTLQQVTTTTPGDPSLRVQNGNFRPSISDDGRFIAFSSNRDLASSNADGNLEIFLYDTAGKSFTQITTSTGVVGSSDAKISGDGSRIAYIKDKGTSLSPNRDLLIYTRTTASNQTIATAVNSVAFTVGRAISDDGSRVVYALQTATNTTQVFLFDAVSNSSRAVTQLLARATDVPLDPTISGDGKRIAFATRRNPLSSNSDGGVELFLFDIPTGQLSQITTAPSSATGEVVSSLNDDGSVAVFNFPRVLSGAVANTDFVNNSEIYTAAIAPRAAAGTATILNGASLSGDPSTPKAVAQDSIAVAQGGALAIASQQAQPISLGNFPTSVAGTKVTVNGVAAQILFVSPSQVNFIIPHGTPTGTANVVVTNSEGFPSTGSIAVLPTAPGVFTVSGDGLGIGVILNADTLASAPLDPTDGNLRLIVFATGVRGGGHVTATIGGLAVSVEQIITSPELPGLDEIHVLVPSSLRGAGTLDVALQSDNRASNSVATTLGGNSLRDIMINEVLADPPGSAAGDLQGDANHDGVRSSGDDEFVELANSTTHDIDMSGYQLLTRTSSATTDTLRLTFNTGTILPACSAIVVFGGGNPDQSNPLFGGAQVLKASSSLSLSNTGGVVTLRDNAANVITLFAYGGSTGLNGGASQSLTRSPDVTGAFVLHQTASGSGGRLFSSGTRLTGTPFAVCPAIARVDVTPTSATIDAGAKQQFTARAFDASNNEVFGVIFSWQSSNTAAATIDQTGQATGVAGGTSEIRASGRGVQSAPATLTVHDIVRVLTSIEISPSSATIPASGAQQFTARGLDQFGNEIPGVTFTWESTNTNVATIDQTGLATGINQGQSTIKASSTSVTGTATLNVSAPTIVVNEVLADPPGSVSTDLAGDANHDGVRSASDDEFVELANATGAGVSLAGWTVRTRASGGTTETLRHTFAAGTTLAAGEAIVIFGGGTLTANDPVFGCAQVVKASSGGLSLSNTGLSVLIRDGGGNLVSQMSYGSEGNNDQSLTRSPDITGAFVQHLAAIGANGRHFSPGLKTDGTPFGNCPGHPASVTLAPLATSVIVGQTTQFTAQAFDQFGRAMTGVPITFTSDNLTAATVESVSTNPTTGIATATVKGQSQGTAHITAQANDGTTAATSSQATLTVVPPQPQVARIDVSPTTATINRGHTQQFSAAAFDQNNQPLIGVFFTWSSSNVNAATIDQAGLASGVGIGAATITASASDGAGGTVSGTAMLNVQVPLVINEINADVGPDNVATTAIEGDANRDGVRDASNDEFIELLNNSTTSVDISGVIIADATSNRFTIPANTILTAGRALVIFGGGSPPVNDPAFGGALVLALTGSGTLSLNDTGDTVNVKLNFGGSDVLIASQTYAGTGNPPAPSDQSLTRSPDAEVNSGGGGFVAHTAATNAVGRVFSPGTRADGTPFGSAAITRIDVSPATSTINAGQTQTFTAHAFSNVGGPEVEILNVCFIWDSSDTSKATVAPITGVTTIATGLASGSPTIRARAGGQFSSATLTVNVPPTLTINDVSANEGNSGTTTFHFVVSLSAPALAGGVTFDIATQDNTATVANNDYVARSLTGQTIAAGQQTFNFDVTVNGDVNIEPNEAFFVNVTNITGATVGDSQGVGTIQNDDSPQLNINDVTASEGNSGTTAFTFTVTSTLPAPAGGIIFDITTADSTATVANNDYVARSLTGQTIPAGQTTYTFAVNVNGDLLFEPDEAFLVNVTNVSGATLSDGQAVGTIQNDDTSSLVISQVYGGGDNSGAPFRNDFVELYNHGTTTVDFSVTPYSIQYAGVGSNFSSSNKTNLTSGTIAPGRYFLVQEAGGTTNGVVLPTPDATGTIAMGSTAGKVALVFGTTALAAATCPGDDGSSPFNPAGVVDFVGYGNTATTAGHCYEGSAPAAAPSNTTADFRKAGGCVDTDDNAADFLVASPNPHNSSSPIGACLADITINDVTVTEGNTGTVNATFTVSLSAASANTVTVNFATADGTATQPADYQANSGTLTFNPGDLTKTITVLVNGDTLDESSETFFVNLSSPVNGALVDGQGQGTITDNDPTPSLSINDVSVAEGDSSTTTATFTVTLSAASGQTVTVAFATADDTAVAGSDYQSNSGTLTFNPGDTTKTITVLVNGDTTFEQAETFFVNLSGPTNATISDNQGQGTITNDDAVPLSPTLFISDLNIAEGNGGTSIATFNVTLSPSSSQTVTVDFATANGTATAGIDYQATSGQITFNPGDTSKPITVTINGDTLVEPDETFFVNLTNATGGATIGDPQALGTIQNDDAINLAISQVYPGGGLTSATYTNDFIELFNRGATTVDFSVTPFSVQFLSTGATTWTRTDLTSGTILPGHYFLIKGSGGAVGATLPAADATGTLNLTSTTAGKVALVANTTLLVGNCPGDDGTAPFNPVNGTVVDFVGYGGTAATANHCYEGAGPAVFTLSNNTIAAFRKAGGCTDTNDNAGDFLDSTPFPRNSSSPTNSCVAGPAPNLTINDVTLAEGNAGTTTAIFTVSLSAPAPATDISFDIATQDNTATTANSDYVAKTLTSQVIPAGQTTYTFSVTINGDVAIEPDETFFVNVTNVVGATLTDGQGIGTIQNDDQPTLTINDVSQSEGNSGTSTFTFTVTLSAPAPATVTFDIATQDNTATTANTDYVARALTGQTIAAGQTTYSFDVTVNGDNAIEPNETFFVNVTNVTAATVGDGQGTGTIQNDDSPVLSITPTVTVAEGNGGTTNATFTVTLSPAINQTVTVDYATANGTATAGSDYQTTSGTLTFNPNETTKTINVPVNGDTLVELDETFTISLSNASVNATVSAIQGTGTGTITNDDTPLVAISQVYPGGGLTGATFTNDFIELFNRGATTVDFSVTPFSVQFLSTGATTWAKTDLTSGTILPGHYFLIKGSGGAVGATLPAADATGTLNLTSTTAGKVALVANTTLLVGNCPGDDGTAPFNPVNGTVVDFVGYGGTAATANHCYEGTGPAVFTLSNNTIAAFRKAGGCTDTNDNAADFLDATPFPRNSSSPTNSCVAGPAPNLTINDVTIAEGNAGTTTATFTVSLSAPAPSTDISFDIATADNSATTANSDYVAKTLTNQIIPAGQTTYTFSVTVNGDVAIEADETFFVNVTNVVGATLTDGQGLGTIQNDDQPALTINDVSQAEGNSGTSTFTFTVTLSAPAPATVTFDIATQDNTATTANTDYVARALTGQTIAAGQTTYTFDVTVNGDNAIEPNESFFVNVSNVTGATVGDGQGTGTIQNDDSPVLSITPTVTVAEGNGGTTNATFTVTLSPAINQTVTVDYATANGTATAGSDYQTTSGTLTFNPNETTKTINVAVNGDTLVELNETFSLSLTNASANATVSGSNGSGTGTITNDDISGVVISQIYPGGGLTGATFTNDFIELFNRGATTVDFSVTPNSVQFLSVSGSIWVKTDLTSGTLAPGQYFLIKEAGGAVGATLPTADATGTINVTSTTAGKVALSTGTTLLVGNCPGDDGSTPFNPVDGTVVDFVGYLGTSSTANHCYEGTGPAAFTSGNNTVADFRKAGGCTETNDNAADFLLATPFPRNSSSPTNSCTAGSPPNLTINDVSIAEGNSGTTTATFTVSLSAPAPSTDISFDIATADGTATTANSDYVAKSLTNQIIPAGQTTYTFSVTINGDLAVEPDETFLVNVTNAVGANITDGQGSGTITNDDSASVSLSINDVSISEGNSGTKTLDFTVTLSASSLQTVTVNYATADGTATTANSDYVSASGLLTFNPGETTKPISVTINGDITVEPDETFVVNLTGATNATISDSQGQGTITNDDSSGSTTKLVISQVFGGGGNAGAAYQNDFVEIFNAGTTTVDFSVMPYSVQYASSAGTFSSANKTDLTTGMVAPGQYFLIKLATGGAVGQTFTADVTNTTVNMSATDGKVALVIGTTVATTTSGCPTAVTVADLLGYGGANCSETTATAVLSATKVDLRKANGCTDTGSNVADFTVTTVNGSSPLPRNSTSPLSPCP